MAQTLLPISSLISDDNETLAFDVGKLGFEVREDTWLIAEKRWAVVSPAGSACDLVLARAVGK